MSVRRRAVVSGLAATAMVSGPLAGLAQEDLPVFGETVPLVQLDMPDLATLNQPELEGNYKPTADEKKRAQEAIDSTPKGPTPIDIAESFIVRYAAADAERISQWPIPSSWNPLVVEFFTATTLKVSNDMTDWCAAFVNWCLHRNAKPYTDDAGSQSFVNSGKFAKTTVPQRGDLAVFTCYDVTSGHTLGLGHVGFYAGDAGAERIHLIAGNQSADGHKSIISNVVISTKPFQTQRHIDGHYLPCTFKLNSFLKAPT